MTSEKQVFAGVFFPLTAEQIDADRAQVDEFHQAVFYKNLLLFLLIFGLAWAIWFFNIHWIAGVAAFGVAALLLRLIGRSKREFVLERSRAQVLIALNSSSVRLYHYENNLREHAIAFVGMDTFIFAVDAISGRVTERFLNQHWRRHSQHQGAKLTDHWDLCQITARGFVVSVGAGASDRGLREISFAHVQKLFALLDTRCLFPKTAGWAEIVRDMVDQVFAEPASIRFLVGQLERIALMIEAQATRSEQELQELVDVEKRMVDRITEQHVDAVTTLGTFLHTFLKTFPGSAPVAATAFTSYAGDLKQKLDELRADDQSWPLCEGKYARIRTEASKYVQDFLKKHEFDTDVRFNGWVQRMKNVDSAHATRQNAVQKKMRGGRRG